MTEREIKTRGRLIRSEVYRTNIFTQKELPAPSWLRKVLEDVDRYGVGTGNKGTRQEKGLGKDMDVVLVSVKSPDTATKLFLRYLKLGTHNLVADNFPASVQLQNKDQNTYLIRCHWLQCLGTGLGIVLNICQSVWPLI